MQFAKAFLQRFGLFTAAEPVDPAYERRLERICASDGKRHARPAAFRPQPSHPEV